MPQIIPAGQLNIAALTADDLYVQIVNPPSFIRGVATDVFGIVGTASWGPVNQAVHLGSGQDGVNAFGAISAASLTDPYDLATDLAIAFGQSSSAASIEGWAVRVTDGTDSKAHVNLASSTGASTETATIGGTITTADTVSITFTSAGITGSPVTVTYTVKAADTTALIAAGLAALINANAALAAAQVTAAASASVVSMYYPSTLTVSFSESTNVGATETVTLASGSANTNGAALTAIYSGVQGNNISIGLAVGAGSNTFTVTITPFSGQPEIFPNISSTNFWYNLYSAINNGITTFRGPSDYVRVSSYIPAVGEPTTGSFSLASGTDGRSGVVTATLLGSDTAQPRTGLYALRQQSPQVGVVWIAGSTDITLVPSEVAFATSEGCSVLFPFPTGTSTTSAVSSVSSIGQHDSSLAYVKDWVYFFDVINNQVRLVSPLAFIGGTIVTYSPENSPGNKPVNLVIGTERNNPFSGSQPYTPSEVAQLENAGIMLITNPIPAGSQFGIRHGQTTSLNAATAPFEYWRMTSYLARSFAGTMGQFVDQLQSQNPQDPLRAQVKIMLNNFLTNLQGLGQIDGFTVQCSFSSSPSAKPGLGVNTPASIAQHYLYALVQVTYLSSVRFFVLSLQGGTTVVTTGVNTGSSLA